MIDALLLTVAAAGVVWFGTPTDHFPRTRLRWIVRASLAFALPAVIALAVLGRWDNLAALPPEFAGLADKLPHYSARVLLPPLLVGLPLGLGIVAARIAWARHRGRPLPASLGIPAPHAARGRRELLPAAAVALIAGVTEELAFRFAIPLLLARLTGSALASFALATAAFVALHGYQAWPGRVGVALTAAGLTMLYLSSGSLWLAMLVHTLIDVSALVLRPWLAGFSSSAATRSERSR